GNVGLELQQLQLDLQQVAFADVADSVLLFADPHCLLKAVEVLEREIEGRLRELRLNELLRYVENQHALRVADLVAGDGGGVFSGIDAALTLLSTLDGVAHANVKLAERVEGVGGQGR